MSRISEMEAQLDALTTAILPPMWATKYGARASLPATLRQLENDSSVRAAA